MMNEKTKQKKNTKIEFVQNLLDIFEKKKKEKFTLYIMKLRN